MWRNLKTVPYIVCIHFSHGGFLGNYDSFKLAMKIKVQYSVHEMHFNESNCSTQVNTDLFHHTDMSKQSY